MRVFAVAGLFAACLTGLAQAATLSIDVAEAGGNVVFTGSGSLDLTGLAPSSTGVAVDPATSGSDSTGFLGAAAPLFFGLVPTGDEYDLGSIAFTALTSDATRFQATGDVFGLNAGTAATGPVLTVPSLYTPGTNIAFTWVAENTTAQALGVRFGTLASFGTDTIEVSSSTLDTGGPGDVANVPLPATAWLFLVALSGLTLLRSKAS